MSYIACADRCWKRVLTSPYYFWQRTVSWVLHDVKKCWSETYRHCVEGCDCWFCWCRVESIACIVWQTVVNLVCTVLTVLEAVVSLVLYVIYLVLTLIRCIVAPCPIEHPAPTVTNCDQLQANLRTSVNDPLSWFDRAAGFLSTPAKETGLSNAWDAYDIWLKAEGEVIHEAESTDGLETIDIKLLAYTAYPSNAYDSTPMCQRASVEGKYIRIEVFPQVLNFIHGPRPQPGQRIKVQGRLYWDRDGFLEIHPEHGGDLEILP